MFIKHMKELIFLVGLKKFEKNFNLIKQTIQNINENCEILSFEGFDKTFFEQSIELKPVAILFYEDSIDSLKSKRLKKIVEINGFRKPIVVVFVESISETTNNKFFNYGASIVTPLSLNMELNIDVAESIFLYRKEVPIRKKGKYAIAKIEMDLNVTIPVTLKSVDAKEAFFESNIHVDSNTPQIITSPFLSKIGLTLDSEAKNISQDVESLLSKSRFSLDIKFLTSRDLEKLSKDLEDDILKVSLKKQFTEMQKKELMSSVLKKRANDLKKQRLIDLNTWYKNNKIDMPNENLKKILVIGNSSYNLRLLPNISNNYIIYYIDKIEKKVHPLLNNMFFDFICVNLDPIVKNNDGIITDKLFDCLGVKTLTLLVEEHIRLVNKNDKISRLIVYNNQERLTENNRRNWEQAKGFKLFFINDPFSEKEINMMLSSDVFENASTTDKGFFPNKIVIDPSNDASIASLQISVFMDIINEKEVIINTRQQLPHGLVLKIDYPINNLYLTLIKDTQLEQSNRNNFYTYRCQINGINQEQIKELRAFIIKYQGADVA